MGAGGLGPGYLLLEKHFSLTNSFYYVSVFDIISKESALKISLNQVLIPPTPPLTNKVLGLGHKNPCLVELYGPQNKLIIMVKMKNEKTQQEYVT